MVKCLNIGKNIRQPIYRSISNVNAAYSRVFTESSFVKHHIDMNTVLLALFKRLTVSGFCQSAVLYKACSHQHNVKHKNSVRFLNAICQFTLGTV